MNTNEVKGWVPEIHEKSTKTGCIPFVWTLYNLIKLLRWEDRNIFENFENIVTTFIENLKTSRLFSNEIIMGENGSSEYGILFKNAALAILNNFKNSKANNSDSLEIFIENFNSLIGGLKDIIDQKKISYNEEENMFIKYDKDKNMFIKLNNAFNKELPIFLMCVNTTYNKFVDEIKSKEKKLLNYDDIKTTLNDSKNALIDLYKLLYNGNYKMTKKLERMEESDLPKLEFSRSEWFEKY